MNQAAMIPEPLVFPMNCSLQQALGRERLGASDAAMAEDVLILPTSLPTPAADRCLLGRTPW